VGILVEGNNNIVEDFQAAKFSSAVPNGTAGVEINGGSNNNINDFNVDHNNNYGVWLRAASNNQINCSQTEHNGNIGTYVGCSANGPINGPCSPAVPPSNNNRIFDHNSPSNTKNGVVIDLGNTGNIVTHIITATGNGGIDLLDENPSCDNNQWFFAAFGTAMPGCID
jgi:parallel beta helix pectate lyase-like protein